MLGEMKQTFILALLCFSHAYAQNANNTYDPDTGLSVFQLLDKYGYPLENHTVKTDDGYILQVHRIPHGRNVSKIGPPVFLMHCLLCASHVWVNNGPGWSLGLILSDLGYDIWLGNERGNMYSRNHETLDPIKNNSEFFDYSFHDVGVHDVSAMIDYVLNITGTKKLHYIGHSKGTTDFFVLASSKPEYNDKVYEMIAIAPVAYMNNSSPLMDLLVKNKFLIETTVAAMGMHEFLPHSDVYLKATEKFCVGNMTFCLDFLTLLCGARPGEFDGHKLTVYTTNTPAGTSMKEMMHLLQLLSSGFFRQYDYGYFKNPKHYNGSHSPPDYDVSKITCPTYFFYSDGDALANWQNVEKLASELPDCHKKKIQNYGHIDFIWGIHAPQYLYTDIVNIIGAAHKQLKS